MDTMDVNLSKPWEMVKDWEAWCVCRSPQGHNESDGTWQQNNSSYTLRIQPSPWVLNSPLHGGGLIVPNITPCYSCIGAGLDLLNKVC